MFERAYPERPLAEVNTLERGMKGGFIFFRGCVRIAGEGL